MNTGPNMRKKENNKQQTKIRVVAHDPHHKKNNSPFLCTFKIGLPLRVPYGRGQSLTGETNFTGSNISCASANWDCILPLLFVISERYGRLWTGERSSVEMGHILWVAGVRHA